MSTSWFLERSDVKVRVMSTGAMLADAVFRKGSRIARPFATAPWVSAGESVPDGTPGHLRSLGGEFAAVPFGSSGRPRDAPREWASLIPVDAPDPPHGAAANGEWDVVHRTGHSVVLRFEPSADEALASLTRTIWIERDRQVIRTRLEIAVRRACSVPVALHPILRLPAYSRRMLLDVDFGTGYTYPGDAIPRLGVTAPWRRLESLDSVPGRTGGSIDLAQLPLGPPVEVNVLLTEVSGPITATFLDDATSMVIDWDRTALPSAMLWVSDRSVADTPWRGRYRGLGVEPCVAAFDFPPSVSSGQNPLTARGVPTALRLEPGKPRRIDMSMALRFHAF